MNRSTLVFNFSFKILLKLLIFLVFCYDFLLSSPIWLLDYVLHIHSDSGENCHNVGI